MKVAYLLYDGFTALDMIGPYEVISRWPDAEIHFVARTLDPVATDQGLLMQPTDSVETLRSAELVLVPGAENSLPAMADEALLGWLRDVSAGAEWVCSVCSGAGLYGAAGLLDGRRVTTHWGFRENVRAFGAEVVVERYVFDGNLVSAAGVSAGIDMALALTARVHGEELAKALQLGIEYDPQPPFDSGAPQKADASTLRLAMRILLGDRPFRLAAAFSGRMVRDRAQRLRGGR